MSTFASSHAANSSTSWFVILAVGMILFSSTQVVPQLLQENFGAGPARMPGGIAALMIAAGRTSAVVQPNYLMAGALAVIAVSMYHFTGFAPDAGFRWS